MSAQQYVVVIPVDTDQRAYVKELVRDGDRSTLRFFQEIVDGYIEVVPADLLNRAYPAFADVSICLNEEGKLVGLPINSRASAWYYPLGDVICGQVALIGPPDDEGNTLGFTKELAERLARVVSRI